VTVDDFDVVCIALAEFKADAPARVHSHGPLLPTVAFELVKADAPQRAELRQRTRNVEREQQVNGGIEVEPTKLVRPFAFPDFSGRGVAPRPDRGKNVLRNPANTKPQIG